MVADSQLEPFTSLQNFSGWPKELSCKAMFFHNSQDAPKPSGTIAGVSSLPRPDCSVLHPRVTKTKSFSVKFKLESFPSVLHIIFVATFLSLSIFY